MKRPSPVGAVTVITAIMVLCLTVFAALAFSSGQAELRLSAAGAKAVSDYYAADKLAAELVEAAIYNEGNAGISNYMNDRFPDAELTFDGHQLIADIAAGTRQTLHINVNITDDGVYVDEWRTVADTEVE